MSTTAAPSTAAAARGSPVRPTELRWLPLDPRAASVGRHPSSAIDPIRACIRCGFRAPAPSFVTSAVAGLPGVWSAHADRHPDRAAHADVARLRDEIHAVSNRISRILDAPSGAVVTDVTIDAPSALAASVEPDLLGPLLRLAAERLTRIVAALGPDDWHRQGLFGDRRIDVEELVLLPLHRSHARLAGWEPCR